VDAHQPGPGLVVLEHIGVRDAVGRVLEPALATGFSRAVPC
jgi:hypothetical protein